MTSSTIRRYRLLSFVACVSLACAFFSGLPSADAAVFPSTYDHSIQRAVRIWWPGMDWHWLKAQLWQESHLNPNARSGVGAVGLAQFMGPTWEDVSRALGYGTFPRTAVEPAINGAAYYMAQLKRSWGAAAEPDQHYLGLCSYNAGLGNCRHAAQLCGDNTTWAAIVPCLTDVTGRTNARQTTSYVRLIKEWFAAMLSGN